MASTQYIKELEEANRQLTAALQKQQQAAAAQIRKESKRQQKALAATKQEAQQTFTDNAQAAYLQKMLARRELPELLYQQGYNGGLTESALIRLENRYGQAYRDATRQYADANAAYNAQLAAIRGEESAQIADSDAAYAKKYADLAYTYQKERAKALEEQRAAALKAAAKASAAKKSSGKTASDKTAASSGSGGYVTGRARSPKDIYYSLF